MKQNNSCCFFYKRDPCLKFSSNQFTQNRFTSHTVNRICNMSDKNFNQSNFIYLVRLYSIKTLYHTICYIILWWRYIMPVKGPKYFFHGNFFTVPKNVLFSRIKFTQKYRIEKSKIFNWCEVVYDFTRLPRNGNFFHSEFLIFSECIFKGVCKTLTGIPGHFCGMPLKWFYVRCWSFLARFQLTDHPTEPILIK